MDVVEAWKANCHEDVAVELQKNDNPLAWLALAMAVPLNVADCVWTSMARAYARDQVGGSAEQRFLRRIRPRIASREPSWHGLEPTSDLAGDAPGMAMLGK